MTGGRSRHADHRAWPGQQPRGQVEVGADGRFTVPISPAQNNGQLLSVVSTDDAGNARWLRPTRPTTPRHLTW
jgi:hypothetical protein